jgi:hypothetical protein
VWLSLHPSLHLSGWKATAGKPEVFTITRISGNGAATVTFATGAPTDVAKPGVDYTPVTQTITWKQGQTSATINVPTFPNQAYAGSNIGFTVTITANGKSSTATGLIVEPAATTAPPPATQTCPDGTVIPAASTCPTTSPPTNSWVSAPLQDGGFARVKAAPSTWSRVGPGTGRALVPGEIVAVYFNGWGYSADNQTTFSIFALGDQVAGGALASDLEGVAPVGSPPELAKLPSDWWIPGLVQATKTCPDVQKGGPGIVAGGIYRAAMVAGTHTKLAAGQTSSPSILWEVFATGDQNAPDLRTAHTVIAGDCLMGQ